MFRVRQRIVAPAAAAHGAHRVMSTRVGHPADTDLAHGTVRLQVAGRNAGALVGKSCAACTYVMWGRLADTTPGLTTHKYVQYRSPAPCRVEYGPFACILTLVQPSQGMPLPNPDPEASAAPIVNTRESGEVLRSAAPGGAAVRRAPRCEPNV